MLHENELVMLFLGMGVFIFTLYSLPKIKRLSNWKLLLTGFYFLLIAWIFTVLEGFFWEEILNFLEHAFYAVSSILIAVWCWKVFGEGSEEGL